MEIEAQVLGRLLLMQSVIASLPDASILPFVVQGLSDIDLFGRVEYRNDAQEETGTSWRYALTSNTGRYGEIHFYPADAERFASYDGHLRNFLFMLVLILDERRHRGIVENYQRSLESQANKTNRGSKHTKHSLPGMWSSGHR